MKNQQPHSLKNKTIKNALCASIPGIGFGLSTAFHLFISLLFSDADLNGMSIVMVVSVTAGLIEADCTKISSEPDFTYKVDVQIELD